MSPADDALIPLRVSHVATWWLAARWHSRESEIIDVGMSDRPLMPLLVREIQAGDLADVRAGRD
jgi:hypothetical protein